MRKLQRMASPGARAVTQTTLARCARHGPWVAKRPCSARTAGRMDSRGRSALLTPAPGTAGVGLENWHLLWFCRRGLGGRLSVSAPVRCHPPECAWPARVRARGQRTPIIVSRWARCASSKLQEIPGSNPHVAQSGGSGRWLLPGNTDAACNRSGHANPAICFFCQLPNLMRAKVSEPGSIAVSTSLSKP